MSSYKFTNGFLVLVEGDKKDKTEWFKGSTMARRRIF